MSDLGLFVGRFHPLLVHFPIALLLLAALLRALDLRRTAREGSPAGRAGITGLVLWLGALGAVGSAAAGLALGSFGGYAGDLFDRHQWLGLAVAATSMASALVWTAGDGGVRWPRLDAGLLAASVLLLLPTSHFGATLTHGEGFLTQYAPAFIRSWVGGPPAGPPAGAPPETLRVYATFVAPVLQAHCVSCHGPARVEGGLRLDTPEAIMKGGDDGPVIVAGRAASSEIVRRVWLPSSHDDAMPPRGHRPLAPADAALLRWWVDQGAGVDQTLADVDIPPDVVPIVEALVGPVSSGGPVLPAASVTPAADAAIAAARRAGFVLEPVVDGSNYLSVHATGALDRIDDEALKALEGVAPQVLWLDLAGTRVTDDGVRSLEACAHLTRLRLNRTAVGDAGLARLASLAHLESLNLYGTRVTDDGLAALGGLTGLRRLYVWQTGVTPSGAAALQTRLPRLVVELGAGGE